MTKQQKNRKANEELNEVEYTFVSVKQADRFRAEMFGREYAHDEGDHVVWALTRTKTAYAHNEALFAAVTK